MKTFGSDTSTWAKNNPELAKGTFGLIAGAAGAAGQYLAASEAQKRQMAYQDWVRQRYSDAVRNLRIPAVNATPVAANGIIGGARG